MLLIYSGHCCDVFDSEAVWERGFRIFPNIPTNVPHQGTTIFLGACAVVSNDLNDPLLPHLFYSPTATQLPFCCPNRNSPAFDNEFSRLHVSRLAQQCSASEKLDIPENREKNFVLYCFNKHQLSQIEFQLTRQRNLISFGHKIHTIYLAHEKFSYIS